MIRSEHKNTCLTYAVARYFNQDPKKTPFFIGKRWWTIALENYFKERGLKISIVKYKKSLLANKKKLYFVQGLSPKSKVKSNAPRNKRLRGINHVGLYRGTVPYYDDPYGTKKFIKGVPLFVYIVEKLPC